MNNINVQYQDILSQIMHLGYKYEDPNRKGVERTEIMDYTVSHNFKDGFPAINLKRLAWKTVVGELLCFLQGKTNIKDFHKNKVRIWDKDGYAHYLRTCKADGWTPLNFEGWLTSATKQFEVFESHALDNRYAGGYLGPIYGAQWRSFVGIDQLASVVHTLKTNPMSTQMIVTAWNPEELHEMALPPCHTDFRIVARPLTATEKADAGEATHGIMLYWNQRSVDTFLGLPFNIASYALLCIILAQITGTVALGIKGFLNNVHLYDNQLESAAEVLDRDPYLYRPCVVNINKDLTGITELDDFLNLATVEDFTLNGYEAYSPLKVDMLARD